jgi:streptogramin lyase
MPISSKKVCAFLGSIALALLVSGCSLSHFSDPSTATSVLPALSGTVHGGQQPVSGANILIYAANTSTVYGASSVIPLTTAVTTNSTGGFSLTGEYTCPSPGALVYIVAAGGNPGLGGSMTNGNIALMTVLGTCGSLTSSTFISINELTTVAAVQALAPFMTDYLHVGVNASNVASLTTAFNSAVAFVDPATGAFRTTTTGMATAPTALMNTLADVIAACINSSGGTANDTTACGKLLQYTSTTTDTITALVSIIHNPTTNISQIFNLVVATPPFSGSYTTVPVSFVAPISVPVNTVSGTGAEDDLDVLRSDSQGNIWLLRPNAGTLAEYDSNLNLLHSFSLLPLGSGGTDVDIEIDPFDNIWVPDGAALLKISSSGTILSPANGYPLSVTGLSYINDYFTSDSSGNIWLIVGRASDNALCAVEYSASGTLVSPATGYCSTRTISNSAGSAQSFVPTQIVADSAGNVYIFSTSSSDSTIAGDPIIIVKFSESGSYSEIDTSSSDSNFGINGAAYDPKYQQFSLNIGNSSQSEIISLNGAVVATTSDLVIITPLDEKAIDGEGNLWTLNTPSGFFSETDHLGNCLVSTSILCKLPAVPYPPLATGLLDGLAIDPAGDVFTFDAPDSTLLKFEGLAAAK